MSVHLTENDYERSCTSSSLTEVTEALRAAVNGKRPSRLLDVGCGYGGIAATLREELAMTEAHGIDVDEKVMGEARAKGVEARLSDVGTERLPYADRSFDILTCFGMLDYLPWYDVAVREFSRVLVSEGLIAVALPNLASWHNRLALLFGYQPRDVEFCSLRPVGVIPLQRSEIPVGHIHTPTTRAFREFMTLMGFVEVGTSALRPANKPTVWPLRQFNALLGRFPSTARRFLYIGRRAADPPPDTNGSWWSA